MRKPFFLCLIAVLLLASFSFAQTTSTTDSISFPAPVKTGGMALSDALATRRSIRAYTSTTLTPQEISQLLWAAQGITDAKGHRTAPSAMAKYFLTVYVASAEGLFQYIPEGHKLKKLSSPDIRAKLSHQPAVTSAPAVFIITGDYDYATKAVNPNSGARWVDVEAGHATQNLLLQATAMQLGAVPSGGNDPVEVAKAASLPNTSRPIYLVPVGHPK